MPPIHEPVEQLPISLFEGVILAVRGSDGLIHVSIRDVCTSMSIDFSSQIRRLRNHMLLSEGLVRFRVITAGGPQEQDFLTLEMVPTWLLMINSARVAEGVRPRLDWFQRYLIREVYQSFAALTGLPEQPHQIEDLADLRRIDSALTVLSERQETLEASQQLARQAWKDLRDEIRSIAGRLAAIEQGTVPISREQRGYLYQIVQAWGNAKILHEPRLSQASAYAACWTAVKLRYRIARYEDLPAAQYADCVAFVRQAYQQLAGTELDLPEQSSLQLE